MIKKVLFLLLLITSTAQAENLRKVDFIRVIDGDTIEVRYITTIRLKDIDCFEHGPADGRYAGKLWEF